VRRRFAEHLDPALRRSLRYRIVCQPTLDRRVLEQ
jgi:hypothetical protein